MIVILFGLIAIPIIVAIVAAIASVVLAVAFVAGAREDEE